MARKPNYQFERMERDRQKAIKAAEKASAKRDQRDRADPNPTGSTDPAAGEA